MPVGYPGEMRADDVVDVVREARALGASVPEPALEGLTAPAGELLPTLDQARRSISDALRGHLAEGGDAVRALDLLDRLDALRVAAHRESLGARDRRLRGVRDALADLRHATTVPELERDAATALGHLGFDRGIVSRLVEGVWTPAHVAVERDPVWAADILAAAREDPCAMTHELPEAALVRRGGSIVVDRVQERDDVYLTVARSSRSPVYTAARIPGRDRTLGFLHGDRYYRGDPPDGADRAVLEAFAAGLGQAMTHLAVLDRTRALLGRLHEPPGVVAAPSGVSRPGPPAGGADADDDRPRTSLDRLTPREREVLAAVAAGGTNYSIARRLGVSEGTVKTHVKNLLHKLEVANRAQAVARWWGPSRRLSS